MSKNYVISPLKFLSREHRQRLIQVCEQRSEEDLARGRTTWPTRWTLVDLALFSGLRVGEICQLKISDLCLEPDSSYIIVRNGKGNRTRTVYVDNKLADHLRWFCQFKNYGLLQPNTPDSPLFTSRTGGHCQIITLEKSVKKAITVAGLPQRYSIHSLRHSYATFMLHDSGDLRFVQKQLGHTSLTMTTLYADVLPEANGRLANKIRRDE
jgi:site-specific recombinase XerD